MGWKPADVVARSVPHSQHARRAARRRRPADRARISHRALGDRPARPAAAETLRDAGVVPFAAYCSDPCDGRTQGTTGMFDSLPYRNDAAITMRRLIRSLPRRSGVMGVATCDKGLPAMMLALAGCRDLPGIIVPGGVTLPAAGAEDAGKVQSIGARFAHGLITLEDAAAMRLPRLRHAGRRLPVPRHRGDVASRRRSARPDAAAQRARAIGEPVWLDMARRSARALVRLAAAKTPLSAILTPAALENAMLVHAAVRRIDESAAAHPGDRARGRPRAGRRSTTGRASTARRRVSSTRCPTGRATIRPCTSSSPAACPRSCCTCARMGLLNLDVRDRHGRAAVGRSSTGGSQSDRRREARARLRDADGVDPDHVIMGAGRGARAPASRAPSSSPSATSRPKAPSSRRPRSTRPSSTPTTCIAIAGRRASSCREHDAIRAIKGLTDPPVRANDVVVLIGAGPLGTGHGRDVSAHVGAEVPAVGQDGRGRHRRALLRRVHRRVSRPRRARRRWPADRSASSRTATSSRSRSIAAR